MSSPVAFFKESLRDLDETVPGSLGEQADAEKWGKKFREILVSAVVSSFIASLLIR
jgi:hypothetical protein